MAERCLRALAGDGAAHGRPLAIGWRDRLHRRALLLMLLQTRIDTGHKALCPVSVPDPAIQPVVTQWIESPLKERFSDNCLPKVNEWIADILAIAQRLSNSAPRKYITQEITAAFASQQWDAPSE